MAILMTASGIFLSNAVGKKKLNAFDYIPFMITITVFNLLAIGEIVSLTTNEFADKKTKEEVTEKSSDSQAIGTEKPSVSPAILAFFVIVWLISSWAIHIYIVNIVFKKGK